MCSPTAVQLPETLSCPWECKLSGVRAAASPAPASLSNQCANKHQELCKELRSDFGLSHNSICLEISPARTRDPVTHVMSLLLSALAVIWPRRVLAQASRAPPLGRLFCSSCAASFAFDWLGLLPRLS